ncbi:winged helix-turn-helix domain-containing protein [Pseudomonas alkylphenolica]|uniref:transcriptional regulator n=1 Tax=Pseudomonas alkylphenolica TaxID=237609 RepID=UPI00339247D6
MSTFFPNIRTGHSEHAAVFCPVLHTLTLLKGEETEKIELGYAGGRLLARLMQEPGQVVCRATLIEHAWSERIVGQGSLNQQVYTLRKILGDEKNRQIIQTVPRRGYLLNPAFLVEGVAAPAPVDEVLENPRNVAAERPAPNHPPAVRSSTRRKRTVGMVVATLLLGYLFSAVPTQRVTERLQGTENGLVAVDNRHPQTQKLLSHTQTLSERLSKMSDKPVVLAIVGGEAGYYHIHCAAQTGQNRTITLHDSETHELSDSLLSDCVY